MDTENNIPKHWQIKELGQVCKLKNGFAFKSTNYTNEGVPIIRISDINGGIVSSNKAVRVVANIEYENYLVENDDILVAMSGATTGKFGIYKSAEKAYQNQRVGKFKILNKNVLNNQFLYHQIHSLKRQIEKDAYGGAQPNISSNKIEQMAIVIPPLPEQQAIVSKIEELFSDLDNGIGQLQKAQQQLKIYRQSLLKWAFEGKLTNKDVKDGKLPEGWKWVKLKELAKEISDGDHQAPPKNEVGVPFITISNVNKSNNKIDFTDTFKVNRNYFDSLKPNRRPQKGDVLYTVTGSFGIPILIDFDKEFCFQRHIGLIRPLDTINQKWIYYLLQSPQVFNQAKETATGTAQKTVALSSLRCFNIPFCPYNQQQLIVDELESKLTVRDKIEETITQSLQQAESLRQSILKKAFEGKLV